MEILESVPDRNLGSRRDFVCLRKRKRVSVGQILDKEAGAEVRDEGCVSICGLAHHSKEFEFHCGHNGILKSTCNQTAIHSQLMMQMQMYVGCPNYFIYLDGGLKEILPVTSKVGKALVYWVIFVPTEHVH